MLFLPLRHSQRCTFTPITMKQKLKSCCYRSEERESNVWYRVLWLVLQQPGPVWRRQQPQPAHQHNTKHSHIQRWILQSWGCIHSVFVQWWLKVSISHLWKSPDEAGLASKLQIIYSIYPEDWDSAAKNTKHIQETWQNKLCSSRQKKEPKRDYFNFNVS